MGALLLAVVPALAALAAWNQADQPDPLAQVRQIEKEYAKKQADWNKSYADAKTDEERQELLGKRPDVASFTKKMLEVADKHPKDAAAFDALAWIMRMAPNSKDGETALTRLAEGYATHPRIGEVCSTLARNTKPAAIKLLRDVLEK